MEIMPIETIYNGYRFRSRLEARWAVFFDSAGIKYQYEPEGFEVKVNEDEKPFRYLPDFYLPDHDIYCEVKPSKTKLYEEQQKLSWMIDYSGPLKNGLLILGQIPRFDMQFKLPRFAFYEWDEGVESCLAAFIRADHYGSEKTVIEFEDVGFNEGAPCLPDTPVSEDLYLPSRTMQKFENGILWEIGDYTIRNSVRYFGPCFEIARQARFEHGEKPMQIV